MNQALIHALLRHPDLIAILLLAMTIASRTNPHDTLLQIAGLI